MNLYKVGYGVREENYSYIATVAPADIVKRLYTENGATALKKLMQWYKTYPIDNVEYGHIEHIKCEVDNGDAEIGDTVEVVMCRLGAINTMGHKGKILDYDEDSNRYRLGFDKKWKGWYDREQFILQKDLYNCFVMGNEETK